VFKVFANKGRSETCDVIRGTLVRYNKKSVTIVTDDGQRWTVSPGFLRKIEEAPFSPATTNVFAIERAKKRSPQ
jgi:hypothetical protein